MAVSQELLDILVCPLDKTPVKLTSDQKGLEVLAVPARLSDPRRHPRDAGGRSSH